MDCNSEKFLSKFVIKEKPYQLYAIIKWKNTKDHLFHIQVFSEDQSWSGDFLYEMCTNFGEDFDENEEQYSNSVRDALKVINNMFVYDFTAVDSDGNVRKFYWKRKFVDSSATRVHGFVTVKKDDIPATKNDIIDFLLNENKNLCLSVEKYKNKTEILQNDLENWKNEFDKFIGMKNSLETGLYGKFVQLLNSKKRRIQELEKRLNDL